MSKKFKIILCSLGLLIVLLTSLFLFSLKRDSKLDNDQESKIYILDDSEAIDSKEENIKDLDKVDDVKDQEEEKEPNSNENSVVSNDKEETTTPILNDKKDNQSTNNNSGSNNDNNKEEDEIKKPDKEETPPKEPEKEENNNVPPVIDENDVYRKKIESTYGITIKYGDEMGDYQPRMLTPTKLFDSSKIKTNLGYIETELKKYPSGFFKDFNGMPLTIYLVESVPNNAFAGFTDKQFMNDIKITMVDSYSFPYTLNHEIMHYIDAFLEIKMYPNNPYDEYMSLNPEGFSYGNVNESYNYGYNSQIKGAYFLNSYSQSSVSEDRAEIFKHMITRVYKPAGMFDEGEVMKKKALIISEQIKTYFPSAKGSQYWDKIIN